MATNCPGQTAASDSLVLTQAASISSRSIVTSGLLVAVSHTAVACFNKALRLTGHLCQCAHSPWGRSSRLKENYAT
jgi:hypothetical protein